MAIQAIPALQENVATEDRAAPISIRPEGAPSIDEIFVEAQAEILAAVDAEQITLYVVDRARNELYSRFFSLDTIREIRVPISARSICGLVALTRQTVNIADAYDKAELGRISSALRADRSFDKRTGFRTTQVLCMPIVHEGVGCVGVLQLLNKTRGDRFTTADEAHVARIATTLGSALHDVQATTFRRQTKVDFLRAHCRVAPDVLRSALAESRRLQVDVESLLVERYKVAKGEVLTALGRFYQVPAMEFDPEIVPPDDVVRRLRLEYLKRNYWVPVRRADDGTLVVLIDNPQDLQKVDSIHQLLKGVTVTFAVGLRGDITRYIKAAAGELGTKEAISELLGELRAEDAPEQPQDSSDVDENDSAIIRLANQILMDAYHARASDIHVEPYGHDKDVVIRFRVDGQCHEYQKIPGVYRRALVARYKIMAHLDIAERRKPQDGKITFKMPEREIELRVATLPTAGGNEDLVMRILSSVEPIPIDRLGLSPRNFRELRGMADKPYGLILVVGPTGSGKTTTLHSVLGSINRPERKIWTAEDPVEITQYGLRQLQVHAKIGLTFAAAMRSFLRADPDVIMVGEMRDEETAAVAIEASLTGHLVLSTLHTNSAVETVVRLLDMGLDPFNFADALLGVLAQRLVRRICERCKEAYRPDRSEYDEIADAITLGRPETFTSPCDESFRLYRGRGCHDCNRTGYRGRAGIHELLVATDEVKRLIQSRARIADILPIARAEGMTTLVQDGLTKALQGITDFRMVKAVAIK